MRLRVAALVLSLGVPALAATPDKLLRVGSDGKPDQGFGKGGVATTTIHPQLVSADGAGGLILVDQEMAPPDTHISVTRLTSNGQPDSAFGTLSLGGPGYAEARAITLDNKGRVLVLATKRASGAKTESSVVYRFTSAGLDTAFGSGGSANVWMPATAGHQTGAGGVGVDSSGRILVGGLDTSTHNVFVTRVKEDGTADITLMGAHLNDPLEPVRPLGDSSGRIYLVTNKLAGSFTPQAGAGYVPSSGAIVVFRFTSAGAPDTSFGQSGSVVIEDTGRSIGALDAYVNATANGTQLVIGGYVATGQDASAMKPTVFRFTESGAADPSFGGGGRVELAYTSSSSLGRVRRVARDGTGRVVIIGAYKPTATSEVTFVTRFTAAGAIDTNYGSNGTTSFNVVAWEPEIDPQGRAIFRAP